MVTVSMPLLMFRVSFAPTFLNLWDCSAMILLARSVGCFLSPSMVRYNTVLVLLCVEFAPRLQRTTMLARCKEEARFGNVS